jgi:threonine/homoserine/homoserine lactone efflux protein
MDASIFFKGLVVGFLIATPVGPIGLLCIQRTLNEGKISGLVSGLGAATADAIFGLIAALGLTFAKILVEEQMWFRFFGGLFLCYLGVKTFLSKPAGQTSSANGPSHIGNYGSTFVLAFTNPITILVFVALFAGLRVVSSSTHYFSVGLSVAGVFIGSALWWFMLCGAAGILHGKISYGILTWLNRISGIIITVFGLVILLLVML